MSDNKNNQVKPVDSKESTAPVEKKEDKKVEVKSSK